VTALFHSAAGDEILKNTFANNAFENFGIAAYKSLITLSQAAGHGSDKELLTLSLDEEQKIGRLGARQRGETDVGLRAEGGIIESH
jgi:ferritin-like metal-binding protein YciE